MFNGHISALLQIFRQMVSAVATTYSGEELTLNSHGKSVISYADYAIAMIDEAENGQHIQQRISVVSD